MKKNIILILFSFLLIMSFANAESFVLDESRTRISYDPPGDNDELIYSGLDDVYIFKSGSLTLTRIENNFTTFTSFYSTGTNTDDFFGFIYNASPLLNGGSLTFPSLMISTNGDQNLRFWEMNIFGVNDVNSVNPVDLNLVTPLQYQITLVNGIEFDTQTNLVYVLYNNSQNVNVYDVFKPDGNWDASWVRSFTLAQNCGYTSQNTNDIEILNNQFYLLCGDALQVPDRTIYSYSLLGDFRDTFTLNTLDNDYHSITFTKEQSEMIVYDNTNNDIAFFNFTENTILGDGVVIIGGEAYNTTGLCINENQFSTNVSIFTNQFGDVFFDSDNQFVEWCSAGCLNIKDNNDVYQGICSQNACNNECNDPGRDYCETPNTYATCSVGNDGCTDLNSGLFCPANFVCEETEIGAQCVSGELAGFSDLWIQPFISIDIQVNNTNVYEVLETDIERTIDTITIPFSSTLGVGVERISNLFLKTLSQTVLQEVKITGIQQLQETNYYGLSCDFTDNYLEIDNLETLDDWTTNNIIVTSDGLTYLQINETSTKTLETSTLSQKLELMLKPTETGEYVISYDQGTLNVLTLHIDYNKTSRNLLIHDDNFDKYIVNETGVTNLNDTLSRIVISTLHLKEADQNNVQIIVIREVNGIETQQIYYSLPISYTSGVAQKPETISFETGGANLYLYHVIQREQSGFPTYSTNQVGTCEYTGLTCSNQVAFVNDRNTPTYYFREDFVTCISILGGAINVNPGEQPPELDGDLDFFEEILGRELTRDGKLIFASVILSLIFGIFVYGFIESREGIVLIGGTILTGLFMLWFSIIGYLPGWIIFVLIAIGGFLAVSFAKGGFK